MPLLKVLTHTPAWLGPGSAGGNLFTPSHNRHQSAAPVKTRVSHIARKVIAYNGSHVYTAVGNEIRWSDLRDLKTNENVGAKPSSLGTLVKSENQPDVAYKILGANIPHEILHISISPGGNFLAVATSTELFAIVLPGGPQLYQSETVIPTTTYNVGSNVHNESRPGISCLLWHPLGYLGSCLVTITSDSVVRLWEFDIGADSSFIKATTTLSLLQMASATVADDLTDGRTANNYADGYFATSETVPAAASFGSPDFSDSCWSPMTLWVAMVPGHVYTLCPFVPTKWEAPLALLASVNSYIKAIETGTEDDEMFEGSAGGILEWYTSLEDQFAEQSRKARFDPGRCVLSRPASPLVPFLQGPFIGTQELESDEEMVDLMVTPLVPPKDRDSYGIVTFDTPSPVMCHIVSISSTFGKIYHMLDLNGSVPKWVPSSEDDYDTDSETDFNGVLPTIEVIDLVQYNPVKKHVSTTYFCRDWISDYTFFVTHDTGIIQISSSYMIQIAKELADPSIDGVEDRLGYWLDSATSEQEFATRTTTERYSSTTHISAVTTSVVIQAVGLGLLVLSALGNYPIAAMLESREDAILAKENIEPEEIGISDEATSSCLAISREAYIPPARFGIRTALPQLLSKQNDTRLQRHNKEEITMSAYSMELMLDAHRILFTETMEYLQSVSHLFIQASMQQQDYLNVLMAHKRAARESVALGKITRGSTSTINDASSQNLIVGLAARFDAVVARQKSLNSRRDRLVSKVALLSGRQISSKDKTWISNIQQMAGVVGLTIEDVGREETEEQPEAREQPDSAVAERVRQVSNFIRLLKTKTEEVVQQLESTPAQSSEVVNSPLTPLAIGNRLVPPSPRFSRSVPGSPSPFASSFGSGTQANTPVKYAREAKIKEATEARIKGRLAMLTASVEATVDQLDKLKLDSA